MDEITVIKILLHINVWFKSLSQQNYCAVKMNTPYRYLIIDECLYMQFVEKVDFLWICRSGRKEWSLRASFMSASPASTWVSSPRNIRSGGSVWPTTQRHSTSLTSVSRRARLVWGLNIDLLMAGDICVLCKYALSLHFGLQSEDGDIQESFRFAMDVIGGK